MSWKQNKGLNTFFFNYPVSCKSSDLEMGVVSKTNKVTFCYIPRAFNNKEAAFTRLAILVFGITSEDFNEKFNS